MVKESHIQARIIDKFKGLGVWVLKMHQTNHTGVPDLLFILPNARVIWMEVKRPGEKPSSKQQWVHRMLYEKYDHDTIVTTSYEEALFAFVTLHKTRRWKCAKKIQAEYRKVFDPKNYQGKYTQEELDQGRKAFISIQQKKENS